MRRALPLAGLLIAWGLLLGAPSCPPPPPATCPAACPLGTACLDAAKGCQPIPPPGPVCEVGVQHCGCWVMPPELGEWLELRCSPGETCTPEKQCAPAPPPTPTCPAKCPAGQSCTDPAVGCAPTPPPPSGGCSIDGEPGPMIVGYKPALGSEVNAAMTALTGCDPGSRCVLQEGRQAWQARVIAELRRMGRCAGQHTPTTDEIAAATSATAPREGWHVYAGPSEGPGTVVWSPGAATPAYAAPEAPPPTAGCSPPAVPKVDRWGLAYRNRWWDSTPLFYGRDTATWTGQPVTGYCEAIGMPRLHCPARQEGDPERRACEGYGIGGSANAVPLWRCEQGLPEVNPVQPFQARCDPGYIEVCSTDGAVCAREVMP